jgi:histidinol dehydrogenase
MSATVNIRRLDTRDAGFDAQLAALQHWSAEADAAIEQRVAEIVEAVRSRGDAAVLEFTARFDRVQASSVAELEIPAAELKAAFDGLPGARREALQTAAQRIRDFHQRQLDASCASFAFTDAQGNRLGQKVTPLDRAGIYVPGGKAAYPSSVLMNAVPAQVAGVREIVMVVPTPGPVSASGEPCTPAQAERNPLVLAAAHLAGVHRVFTLGGAQAVAALAYGTATVPRVDKITGPGNAYVASAKRRVFGQVGIDMIAGPSEILVLADGTTPPDWVAMDLFSQAEHDELAQSILLCPDAAYIEAVQAAIDRLLPEMPRQAVIRASLEGRGALVLTRSMEEACAISNRIAPEHLEVCSREPRRWEPLLRHAGAIFLGAFSSESLGDYCAGPNHVLPTSGTARFSSPLGVYDFVKRSSLIEVSAAGAQALGAVASTLAHGEGLQAHARAAEMRLGAQDEATAAAPPPPGAGLEVRELVTRAQAEALMRLDVTAAQQPFVAPVAKSIAQAAFEPNARQFGLYADGEAVGYLLLWDGRKDPDEPDDELWIWRVLIDQRFQRRGLGHATMQWVIDEARRMGVRQVGLSHGAANTDAGAFYQRLGFAYSGQLIDGERVMALPLNALNPLNPLNPIPET